MLDLLTLVEDALLTSFENNNSKTYQKNNQS